MDQPPNEKKLETVSFSAHVTRGIIRDQRTRRRAMLVIVIAALVMLVAGVSVLREALDAHEHAARFILYWLACGWLTFAALLLGLFDVLVIRAEARREAKRMREDLRD